MTKFLRIRVAGQEVESVEVVHVAGTLADHLQEVEEEIINMLIISGLSREADDLQSFAASSGEYGAITVDSETEAQYYSMEAFPEFTSKILELEDTDTPVQWTMELNGITAEFAVPDNPWVE